MKHYSREQWVLYKTGRIPEENALIFEEHLRECDGCLETFLSLIDEQEIDRAKNQISQDFSHRLMTQVKKVRKPEPANSKKTWQDKRKNLFMYYIAASVVTFMLMSWGMFEGMVNAVPDLAAASGKFENRISTDLPEKIVGGAHKWIQNFEEQGKGGLDSE
ncbi:MAG: hypothetical protein ACOX8P_13845 [Tepidanaerobacteraceae bacterium]|jgi:anti-sigma factor RsiW